MDGLGEGEEGDFMTFNVLLLFKVFRATGRVPLLEAAPPIKHEISRRLERYDKPHAGVVACTLILCRNEARRVEYH